MSMTAGLPPLRSVVLAPQAGISPDADSWRSKLLLQVLRETGDEMKRRRQTLREVLARNAAERGGGGASGGGSALCENLGNERLRKPRVFG